MQLYTGVVCVVCVVPQEGYYTHVSVGGCCFWRLYGDNCQVGRRALCPDMIHCRQLFPLPSHGVQQCSWEGTRRFVVCYSVSFMCTPAAHEDVAHVQ